MKKCVILLVFIFVCAVCAQHLCLKRPLGATAERYPELMKKWFKRLDGQNQGPVVDEYVLRSILRKEFECSVSVCDQETLDELENLKRYPGLGILLFPYLEDRYDEIAKEALKKLYNVDINVDGRVSASICIDYIVVAVSGLRDGGVITFLISQYTRELLSTYRYTKAEWEEKKDTYEKYMRRLPK